MNMATVEWTPCPHNTLFSFTSWNDMWTPHIRNEQRKLIASFSLRRAPSSSYVKEPHYQIWSFGCTKEYRGQGYAARLMRVVLEVIDEQNPLPIWLCTSVNNRYADFDRNAGVMIHEFYKKFGFVEYDGGYHHYEMLRPAQQKEAAQCLVLPSVASTQPAYA